MSEMVERVARAVALQDCCDPDFVDTKGRVQWTYHVELARAAIAAMREPTIKMESAGATNAYPEGLGSFGRGYRAAIDEALK